MLGDFVNYLRNNNHFDLVVASGVLYHLVNPVEAIALMSKVTERLYIWSHYYDEGKVRAHPLLAHHFQSSSPANYEGFGHTLHRQHYQTRLGNPAFNGGSQYYSHWLSREDLIGALNFFGFKKIRTHFDHADESIGPSISLMAERTV